MAQIAVLTEGHSNPRTAKTACSVIRYRRDEIAGVIDSTRVGEPVSSALGVGDPLRFVVGLDDLPEADALLLGIAPPGGRLPGAWRPMILAALGRSMEVISGLHDFLADDPELAAAAAERGGKLTDVRRGNVREVATRIGLRPECRRILTVGHDCSVGKMVAAIEVQRELVARGRNAAFVATGQTGIMIAGAGVAVDCVVADFISGAAERLVRENQHHDILLIEGQGSLAHPSYSGVTLGLLHGAFPHGLIFCYEAGRDDVGGLAHVPIPPLTKLRELYEQLGGLHQPCPVIGAAVNTRRLDDAAARREIDRVSAEWNLPACDVLRTGPVPLADAVERL